MKYNAERRQLGVLTHFALMNHVSPPAHQGVRLEARTTADTFTEQSGCNLKRQKMSR